MVGNGEGGSPAAGEKKGDRQEEANRRALHRLSFELLWGRVSSRSART